MGEASLVSLCGLFTISTSVYLWIVCKHLSIHVFSPNKSKFLGHSLLLHTPLAHIRSHGLFCSPYMELRVGKRGTQHVRKDLQSWVSTGEFTLQETVEWRQGDGYSSPPGGDVTTWCRQAGFILVYSHPVRLHWNLLSQLCISVEENGNCWWTCTVVEVIQVMLLP